MTTVKKYDVKLSESSQRPFALVVLLGRKADTPIVGVVSKVQSEKQHENGIVLGDRYTVEHSKKIGHKTLEMLLLDLTPI